MHNQRPKPSGDPSQPEALHPSSPLTIGKPPGRVDRFPWDHRTPKPQKTGPRAADD